jgi:hypothetical protein
MNGDLKTERERLDLGGCSLKNPSIVLSFGVSVMLLAMRTSRAAGFCTGTERFVHDLADGGRAASALRAATEAAVNLPGGPRQFLGHGIAHVVVCKDVAGADDHGVIEKPVGKTLYRYFTRPTDAKAKRLLSSYSKLLGTLVNHLPILE